MSDRKSWKKKSTEIHTEAAIEVVRSCVAFLRARGVPTKNALIDLAPDLQISERRVRTLFHRDGEPVVLKNEWLSLRYRAGLMLLNQAEYLRGLAGTAERAGEELISDQLEFSWSNTWNAEDGSLGSSQKRCA